MARYFRKEVVPVIRSLWTGAAGLVGHQTYLDVLGNNVSNINTVGFRQGAPRFEDLLFSTEREATGPGGGIGGVSPLQVGHGTLVQAIDIIHSQGPVVPTGIPSNLAINGAGYFVVQSGDQELYTRAGNFVVDGLGRVVQSGTGAFLLGVPAVGGVIPENPGALTPIQLPTLPAPGEAPGPGYEIPPRATGEVTFRCNLDKNTAAGDSHETSIVLYDPLGGSHSLRVTWTPQVDPTTGDKIPNAWHWQAFLDDDPTPVGEGDLAFRGVADPDSGAPAGTVIADGTERPSLSLTFPPDPQGVTPDPASVVLDFGGGGNPLDGVTQYGSPSTTRALTQDGYPRGYYEGFSVSSDGTLVGYYSNDVMLPLYRIPMATVRNPMGLQAEGDNNFSLSSNSGSVGYVFPGTQDMGTFVGGAVEMSNMDAAAAFTELIVAQRSYQANARIVTTSDRFLQVGIELRK